MLKIIVSIGVARKLAKGPVGESITIFAVKNTQKTTV